MHPVRYASSEVLMYIHPGVFPPRRGKCRKNDSQLKYTEIMKTRDDQPLLSRPIGHLQQDSMAR